MKDKKDLLCLLTILMLAMGLGGCKIAGRGGNWDKRIIEPALGLDKKSNVEDAYSAYEKELKEKAAAESDSFTVSISGKRGRAQVVEGESLNWYLFPLGIRLNTKDEIGGNTGVALSVGFMPGDSNALKEIREKESLFYAPVGRYLAMKTKKDLADKETIKLELLALANKGILERSTVKEVEYEFYKIK